jgi:nucleoside diphosphate kinase
MADKLTYVLITPYSLLKSRTGGIIGRILALSRDVRFVGARMYAPSDDMVSAYLETLSSETLTPTVHDALVQYVDRNLRRDNPFGISNRMMLLLFEGPDPIRSLREDVVGALSADMRGDTIRGTYGDFVLELGKLAFFEPAVLMPTTDEANERQLKVLADFAMSDGGILDRAVRYPDRSKVQTTLVIIKPDNFMRRSSRPGNIIDMFSRTGLYVVAAKLFKMRLEQADEFYGPLRQIFRKKLVGQVASRAGAALAETFDFPITDEMKAKVADALKDANAEYEFSKIVNYMTGNDETGEDLSDDERGKCVALLYQGVDAIDKIRKRLGATNPKEAEDGTVRSVYGYDLMKNGAHASDSPESAERERKIIGLWDEGTSSDVQATIEDYLAKAPKV